MLEGVTANSKIDLGSMPSGFWFSVKILTASISVRDFEGIDGGKYSGEGGSDREKNDERERESRRMEGKEEEEG